MSTIVECSRCDGTGFTEACYECPYCNGSGTVVEENETDDDLENNCCPKCFSYISDCVCDL